MKEALSFHKIQNIRKIGNTAKIKNEKMCKTNVYSTDLEGQLYIAPAFEARRTIVRYNGKEILIFIFCS